MTKFKKWCLKQDSEAIMRIGLGLLIVNGIGGITGKKWISAIALPAEVLCIVISCVNLSDEIKQIRGRK